VSWENNPLLSCPQEPPEDDANIIEKILASRMVQKEVSGKGASGAGGPWAEDRWDLAALCSRDMKRSRSGCCRAIPCTRSSLGAVGLCLDWHLSGLVISVVPFLTWAPESRCRVRPGLMPRR